MLKLVNVLKRLALPATGLRADIDNSEVGERIEHVIDAIDPRLRLVPGYRRKLHQAVSHALNYIDELVDRIPGPINIDRKTFINDPDARAYFATPAVMQDTISHATELQSYFSSSAHCGVDGCCALLCANIEEKTIMGTGLRGDVLQHDIIQTSINFTDYKVIAPAPSDDEVRAGIKNCIFDGLITYTLQQIASIKIQRRDLTNEHRILCTKLRERQSKGNGLTLMLTEAGKMVEESAAIRAQIAAAEKKLNEMLEHKDVLSFYLDEIRRIFSTPEKFIHLNKDSFKLTDMRIKVNDNTSQSCNSVNFSEIEIINVLKRVVAIIHYQRENLFEMNDNEGIMI